MNEALFNTIKSLAPVPDSELIKLADMGKHMSIHKGDYFIMKGQVPRKFAFVESGLFRYYYSNDKGTQFTKGFFPEYRFLSSYSAMIQETPSHFTIEALEDSKILVFDYAQWQQLCEGHPSWTRFLLKLIEFAFTKKETREREFLLYDAETRYRQFLENFPGLEGRVKQHIIASYLGITSVALSRIRKNMGVINIG